MSEHQPIKLKKQVQASERGRIKSALAAARWCNKPVTLPPYPWDDDKQQEQDQ